ncbi:MAG: sialate O-acetylesterase [Armatimonadota bacterium]|nr:sialate O-acetylesterase [bacterium]
MKAFKLAIVLVWTLCLFAVAQANVNIQKNGDTYSIKADRYQATIARDGCLTNLVIDGKEFLMPGVSYSRGSYFYKIEDKVTCALPDIHIAGENTVSAKGADAEITYTFTDDAMNWAITNKLPTLPIRFYMAINPNIGLGKIADGDFQDLPLVGPEPVVEFLLGKTKVKIGRSLKVWGPWAGNAQIWEGILDIGETRVIEFKFSNSDAQEQKMLANVRVGNAPNYDNLNISAPSESQVFQRDSHYTGPIRISGKCDVQCDIIEYQIKGKSLKGSIRDKWQRMPFDRLTGCFNYSAKLAAGGWYELNIRALLKGKVVGSAYVRKFGVGEVFIGAGQSNSTNHGQFRTKQTSGMVSCFDGRSWQIRDDPFQGTHDMTMEGSYYPAFGDAMYAKLHVPIGVASTGHGGTAVNDWDTHGELFGFMVARINQLGPGGFRAVLWHQGESDAYLNTPSDVYYEKMCKIIKESNRRAGWSFPWFVAQVSYMDPGNQAFPRIRDVQKKLWDERIALEGPDTDLLTGDNRDYDGKGIHLSPKGLTIAGQMWADKVSQYVISVLER